MSRSRSRHSRRYLPIGAKQIESGRFRARERRALKSDREIDLPAKVAHHRRWNLWSWD